MIELAVWIIAIVEVIRAVQNFMQLRQIKKESSLKYMERATDEFVKSLNKTDKEFIRDLFEKEQGNDSI